MLPAAPCDAPVPGQSMHHWPPTALIRLSACVNFCLLNGSSRIGLHIRFRLELLRLRNGRAPRRVWFRCSAIHCRNSSSLDAPQPVSVTTAHCKPYAVAKGLHFFPLLAPPLALRCARDFVGIEIAERLGCRIHGQRYPLRPGTMVRLLSVTMRDRLAISDAKAPMSW